MSILGSSRAAWMMKGRDTFSHLSGRETARSASLLLDVVGSLAATRAEGVSLVVARTERGCSLGHFLCFLTEMKQVLGLKTKGGQ